jgi:hypothetical protein
MAGELVETKIAVAGEIVLEVLRTGNVWEASTSGKMAEEIATVYRIVYDAIGDAVAGSGGGPRTASKRTS